MSEQPEPTVRPTRYVVSCLPETNDNAPHFSLNVEYRGRDLWAVVRHGSCLSAAGQWSHESVPSQRDDEWLAEHRFDLDTALKLAKEAAPTLSVNGFTVAHVLRWAAPEAEV
ncbi:hypothetical protein [Streptomyces goshikiensis]|uniref:hypothetical protein n=1 Tax=Streptomyces goshikiensis TaxID=1942 RepID=UPI0036916865